MSETRVERRLAAILAADVVGYSRLMGVDEEGTLSALKAYRHELIDPKITERRGRIVKTMGDGLLVEFASAVDAVRCALDIQRALAERNANISETRRIEMRVGINVGDIIIDGTEIYGDGVNLAARLESIADRSGIYISRQVFDQIDGKIDVAYRKVGRRNLKNIAKPVEIFAIDPNATGPLSSEAENIMEIERFYRENLKKRLSEDAEYFVPLAGVTHEFVSNTSPAPRSQRRRRQRAQSEYHEWLQQGEEIKQVELSTLQEAVDRYPCVILLGDPGCGKTSALENLAYQYAFNNASLPVLLHLGTFKPSETPDEFIRRSIAESSRDHNVGKPGLDALLRYSLEAGRLIFLFDALNEMPQEHNRENIAALRQYIDRWSTAGNRFVVSCRLLDYSEELYGLQRVAIQPLSDERIRRFIENELPDGGQALWLTLSESGVNSNQLLEMARNPYILTVMIDVFEQDGTLIQNRATLMRRFVGILMDWADSKAPNSGAGVEQHNAALSIMAFEMQRRSGFGTTVKTADVKAILPRQIEVSPGWPAQSCSHDALLTFATDAKIIEMGLDRRTLRFYHQLLQEFFAAQQMVKYKPSELAPFWRLPLRNDEMPRWERPKNNFEPLPPPPSTGWEETTIIAAGLASPRDYLVRAVCRINPVLAGRCLLDAGMALDSDLRKQVTDALIAVIADPDAALRARIAAGEVLGQLGDPRLGEMAVIPAGEFVMGEGSERHTVILPAYRIGKYPVTNSEFASFVSAGGYDDPTYWTQTGWEEVGQERSEPRFWLDPLFNRPNQPAIGLSFHECVAYCRWLSARTNEIFRLPTEAEWEKSARGRDGRRYPWGEMFDASKVNAREGNQKVYCSTPVGIYPSGVSPFDLYDCAGNSWEWCATRWKKPYPYNPGENEWNGDYLEGRALRALRGGSWNYEDKMTECSHRFRFEPLGWDDRGGFRIVCPALG